MLWCSLLVAVLFAELTHAAYSEDRNIRPLSADMIRFINEESGALWRAGHSEKFRTVQEARRYLGALRESSALRNARRPTVSYGTKNEDLPERFDARENWTFCQTISQIRDQSSCGSCWAFGAVEAMSDRLCIHTKGTLNLELSALDLLSCCSECGHGCHGGWSSLAWDYWKNEGIVTGGSMEDASGCRPYPFPACTHHGSGRKPQCEKKTFPTPRCNRTCHADYYGKYQTDKTFAISSYNVNNKAEDIMQEILTNGPVEAGFDVYEDFLNYESGIYHHVTGDMLSGHAIRILGWGVENEVKYWLCANSWNEEWGENGYFRFRRGYDDCGIESEVTAGMPNLSY